MSDSHDDRPAAYDPAAAPGRPARPAPPAREERTEGGDPVCWLDRVCDECGAMREDMTSPVCARCGTPFPGAGGDTGSGAAPAGREGAPPHGE